MKARVKVNLNERTQKPSVNAPNPSYFRVNEEIEIVEIVNGDTIDNNKVWYKLKNGSYVWSGGVEGLVTIKDTNNTNSDLISFDDFMKGFSGDGSDIGIAYLDSGVNETHPFLKDRIKHYDSFLANKSKVGFTSHGNRIAGILASDDPAVKRNKSDLYCFRVADSNDKVYNTGVVNTLNEIDLNLSSKIDIVNMSIDIKSSFIPKVQVEIDKLFAKHVIVIVSAGENNFRNNISFLKNVINVATFDDYKIPDILSKGLESTYTVAFPNRPISSYSIAGKALDATVSQDSAYCAAVSSLVARKIQDGSIPKDANRLQNTVAFLESISFEINNKTKISSFKPYKP
ncbi:S8 family serine peptidase [Reichenbachiella sp.]|uniref:S8 family serine peptidase n=1 Tax=Reichenbachiella sp. TaxID=2184521 RepID=UPI003296F76F